MVVPKPAADEGCILVSHPPASPVKLVAPTESHNPRLRAAPASSAASGFYRATDLLQRPSPTDLALVRIEEVIAHLLVTERPPRRTRPGQQRCARIIGVHGKVQGLPHPAARPGLRTISCRRLWWAAVRNDSRISLNVAAHWTSVLSRCGMDHRPGGHARRILICWPIQVSEG